MAILIINSKDFTEKLKDFSITCKECGSKDVTFDIDWAAYPSDSWCKVTVICNDCGKDEQVFGHDWF